MENLHELYTSLAVAQGEFKTPKKDKKAHYGPYASIGSINEAVREAMTKNGLAIIQPMVTIESRMYVKTLITHKSGSYIESLLPIPEIPNNTKNYFHALGAACSYLRRYALQSMLGISADDLEDDGDSLNNLKVNNKILISDLQCQSLVDLYNLLSPDNKKKAFKALNENRAEKFNELESSKFEGYSKFLGMLVEKDREQFLQELEVSDA